jgi:hypothetical protein
MVAILDFIFSSNLWKKQLFLKNFNELLFFSLDIGEDYKMNKNINSLDYFYRFIQKPLARNRVTRKLTFSVHNPIQFF